MWRLLTFGGLTLESLDGSPAPRLRPQRLAILAVLAASERGMSRERMCSLFWPDADEERAGHSLRQALYALRQEIGADVVQSDAILLFDRERVGSDVADFRAALAAGDNVRAASLAAGPFLDGFFLAAASEFERWAEDERATLAREGARALLTLAKDAESRADLDAAADWWRRLTLLDPLSGRYALGYLRALAARGDRAGALRFAREHEHIVRRELESDPDPEIRKLEAELRSIPSPAIERAAPVLARAESGLTAIAPSVAAAAPPPPGAPQLPAPRRFRIHVAAVAAIALIALAASATANRWLSALGIGHRPAPIFAVGMIGEEGIPDTLRIGGVLTDMLATNLARVAGLSVLANTRLFELMRPGQDTLAIGYYDAAQRAGATEIFQGRLLPGPQWSMALEIQRVDLATGVVKSAYRVQANDRYSLVDSMTASIANDLRLRSPASSVADATTASPVAYRLYEEGLRAMYQYDYAAALRLMAAALEQDSTFAMAAYYEATLKNQGDPGTTARNARVLELASQLPDLERLIVTFDMLVTNVEPASWAVAESLATKYPNDPRAHERLARARYGQGRWPEAVAAVERAVAIDSASEPPERQACRVCSDMLLLSDIYFWWDSLPAAERTAHRALRLRPRDHYPWNILVTTAAIRGDTASMNNYSRRFHAAHPTAAALPEEHFVRGLMLAENYDEAERRMRPLLQSPLAEESGSAGWLMSILLRYRGRIDEARRLSARAGASPGDVAAAMAAFDQGDSRSAVKAFRHNDRVDESIWPPGLQARRTTWKKTLLSMAVAAAGDTLELRRLVDSVEYWGQRSAYGRDRQAHHYVRGMLLVARRRDTEAVVELRAAIHSPTHGFTRVNYELGKALLRLNRADEAIPIVRSALHGGIDGSNFYMSRTELHELLAQAFARANMRDSAAAHYRAVVTAWERADPPYRVRVDSARAWLQRHSPD